ncbi:MAG: hypothetical protein EOP93_06655 [Lysobacteraceae bacterium]|nr:MAG: hypothetical protein EOP93_06655 [Xanthomonadaceae bacterium]
MRGNKHNKGKMMNMRLAAMTLAALGGGTAVLLPATGMAANVGMYGSCYGGSKNTAIAAAGHTAVAVGSLDAASLHGLGGLVIENCNGSNLSNLITVDVKAAVSNGMLLIVDDWNPQSGTSSALPGTPAITWQSASGSSIDLAAGMPYATGPGGTLTNASLDGGNSSNHGLSTSPIPAGITQLLTTANPLETVAIAYMHGNGRVVYSAMPLDAYLPGGQISGSPIAPGVQTYMTNLIACSLNAECGPPAPTTTCASEGYTGTQLTWCRNICEMNYTGSTLSGWIRRWTDRYRTLPYCAVQGGGGQPQ